MVWTKQASALIVLISYNTSNDFKLIPTINSFILKALIYLFERAVNSVRPADVKTEEHSIWVTVAQRPDIIIIWRTCGKNTANKGNI